MSADPNAAASGLSDAVKYEALVNKLVPILESPTHENAISWMYLDYPGGNLTIGAGHLIIHNADFSSEDTLKAAIENVFPYGFKTIDSAVPDLSLLSTSFSGSLPRLDDSNLGSFLDAGSTVSQIGDNAKPGVWGMDDDLLASYLWSPTVDGLVQDAESINDKVTSYNHSASYYKKFNRYELTSTGIDRLVFDDIVSKAIPPAKAVWPGFDSLPEAAQLALLDIVYQGTPGGMNVNAKDSLNAQTFEAGAGPAATAFNAAINGNPPDFKKAADLVPSLRNTWFSDGWDHYNSKSQTSRDGKRSDRTTWRINQFLQAATVQQVNTAVTSYFKNRMTP